eukprot:Clim_evm75s149 gene=Clim_evmTU75s149
MLRSISLLREPSLRVGSLRLSSVVKTAAVPQALGQNFFYYSTNEGDQNKEDGYASAQSTPAMYKREMKRFWKVADAAKAGDNQWTVKLDGRGVKTPTMRPLVLPTEELAFFIAAEFAAQNDTMKPYTMPIYTIVNTVIDQDKFRPAEAMIRDLLGFLETDTTCCRHEYPQNLVQKQADTWDPYLTWFNKTFSVNVQHSASLLGPAHSEEDIGRIRTYLESLNPWKLTALETSVHSTKSLLISLALLERQVTLEEAVTAARLEVDTQIDQWGNVEWAHSLDEADMFTRNGAAALVWRYS